MCRQAESCILLGNNPDAWNKAVLLPPPMWFEDALLIFRDAAEQAAAGNRREAIQILKEIRSEEMRDWFSLHGEMSGEHRAKRLGIPSPIVSPNQLGPHRSPSQDEQGAFERDSYTCRYCGLRQIA